MPWPSPDQRGFTLLELLVVLSVVALLLALATPLLSRGWDAVELRAAARDLASALRTAAVQAVIEGEPRALLLDLEARSYRLGDGGEATPLPAGLELMLVTAEDERAGEREAGIRFFPDGSSTGGQVELRNRLGAYRIAVEWVTGRVSLAELEGP